MPGKNQQDPKKCGKRKATNKQSYSYLMLIWCAQIFDVDMMRANVLPKFATLYIQFMLWKIY